MPLFKKILNLFSKNKNLNEEIQNKSNQSVGSAYLEFENNYNKLKKLEDKNYFDKLDELMDEKDKLISDIRNLRPQFQEVKPSLNKVGNLNSNLEKKRGELSTLKEGIESHIKSKLKNNDMDFKSTEISFNKYRNELLIEKSKSTSMLEKLEKKVNLDMNEISNFNNAVNNLLSNNNIKIEDRAIEREAKKELDEIVKQQSSRSK